MSNPHDEVKLVLILDESGSMNKIRSDIIISINKLINDQKRNARTCYFTCIKFSDNMDIKHNNIPISEVKEWKYGDYTPLGNTCLYDAIGKTLTGTLTGVEQSIVMSDGSKNILDIKEKVVSIDLSESDKNVIVVIVTDGVDNFSKEYSRDDVATVINQRKTIGWNFIYLCNDLLTTQEGINLGIVNEEGIAGVNSQTNIITTEYSNIGSMISSKVSYAVNSYISTSQMPNLSTEPSYDFSNSFC